MLLVGVGSNFLHSADMMWHHHRPFIASRTGLSIKLSARHPCHMIALHHIQTCKILEPFSIKKERLSCIGELHSSDNLEGGQGCA